MLGGSTAFREWLQEKAKPGVDAIMGGMHAVMPGKKMLDEGGAAAELAVLALKMASDAVMADADILERIQAVIGLYREAVERLKTQAELQAEGNDDEQLARFVEAYQVRLQKFQEICSALGNPPPEPPITPEQREAIAFLELRMTKKQYGLRWNHVGADDSPVSPQPGESEKPRATVPSSDPVQRIESLIQQLFNLQDLNGNGVLEELELVKLNEKIAMLHYGKDTDKSIVQARYRDLFRAQLDSSGQPVPFPKFCVYMRKVLTDIDQDWRAQEMILEQWIAEAEAARAAFHCKSFMSTTDAPFLKHIAAPTDLPGS